MAIALEISGLPTSDAVSNQITVNWEDAQRYVRWLSRVTGKSYRLLSESEWEYAARAATLTRYSFGDDESLLGHYGWHTENSGHQAHPVGEKRPNEFGLYDMHGNVWEWVEDCWNSDFKGAPADGAAWLNGECSRRVIRGGSWNEDAGVLRSASRNRSTTGDRGNNLGLRVACSRRRREHGLADRAIKPQPFFDVPRMHHHDIHRPSPAGIMALPVYGRTNFIHSPTLNRHSQ